MHREKPIAVAIWVCVTFSKNPSTSIVCSLGGGD